MKLAASQITAETAFLTVFTIGLRFQNKQLKASFPPYLPAHKLRVPRIELVELREHVEDPAPPRFPLHLHDRAPLGAIWLSRCHMGLNKALIRP